MINKLELFENLKELRIKGKKHPLWQQYIDLIKNCEDFVLVDWFDEFLKTSFPCDKELFDEIYVFLFWKETDFFNSLLYGNRYDLLMDSPLFANLKKRNIWEIMVKYNKPSNVYACVKNYFILEGKSVENNDFLLFMDVFENLKDVNYKDNLWGELTSVLLFFREKLNNKVIDSSGNSYGIIEYVCKTVINVDLCLKYRKEFIDDCYKNLKATSRYVSFNIRYLLFSKLESIDTNSVMELICDAAEKLGKISPEQQVIAIQNLEFVFPLIYKTRNWENSKMSKIRDFLRRSPFYFMYMEMRGVYNLESVDEMESFLNNNPEFLNKYISAAGLTGSLKGTDIKEQIQQIANLLIDVKPYVSLYNYIDDTINDGPNNLFFNLFRLLANGESGDKEKDWDIFLMMFDGLESTIINPYFTFNYLVDDGYVREKDSDEESNKDLYPVFSSQSKEEFLSENLKSPNDTLKMYANKIKGSIKQYRNIAKAETLLNEIDLLYNNFPNFEKVTEYIEDMLRLQMKGNGMFYVQPLILAGPPGVGKTYYLTSLMKMAGTFMNMISYQNVTASFVLTGGSSQWSNGSPGLVFNTIMNSKCDVINPIIVLDEIDKSNSSSNYSTEDCLLGLLETHTAKEFKDECVPIPINASHITWLATANNINNISDPLKNRFDIIDIPLPNLEQKRKLVKNIYKSIIINNPWGSEMDVNLPDETVEKFVEVLNTGVSRDLRKMITKSCAKSVKENSIILLPKHIDFKQEEKLPWDA